ncbi:MAG: oligoendopeptidase F [Ignavibacteriaceae bacterium]|nr:oligoendopeptidase F [Ignavibacteriaceae bacterium]
MSTLRNRDDIEEKYKWDLTHIYKSDSDWELDFSYVENQLPKFDQFQGKLSDSAELLLACLKFHDEIGIKLDKLSLYAMLYRDTDMKNQKSQAMYDRIQSLYAKTASISSFVNPEILNIPTNKLEQMIISNPELKVYKHFIDDLIRTKSHTLSKDEEKILALSEEITSIPYDVYSILTNADISFPRINDENGNEIEISHSRFYAAMHSKDREFRKRAFKNYLQPYQNYVNTFNTMFNGNLKSKIFSAKARKYSSAKEASLSRNNIPLNVYDNLIETTNKNLYPLHRWAETKKKLLQIDELHPYDVYVSIFNNLDEKKYTFSQAAELVTSALQPMGEDYLQVLKMAFENRWIDVYGTTSKRSGAYSSGTTFGIHPYVLLNWENLLNDVFTLAHEMGHNMHSYFTGQNQPYPYANYSIFLAEVASTFNESLLLDYLVKNASNKTEKLYFMEIYLNNISATFYRQVMFAEFEKTVYEELEKGNALTVDYLRKLYKGIFQKYWGESMVIDVEEEFTWARVPHFYYNFYVYQYATGFAASQILTQKILCNGTKARDNYLNFLKAGNSDYPINILKNAGVDMNSPEPILSVTQKMDSLLDEMEILLNDNN